MWYNPILKWLLQSPFHGMVSGSTMLITVTGHKSGKEITTPVNYVDMGGELLTVSFRRRHWWRNLRGGAPVTLRLRGRDAQAHSMIIEDDEGVATQLGAYFKKVPQYAKYLHVRLDEHGVPMADDVLNSAKERVVILTRLGD
jgi:deazaflavin-dependent oxidoreductase (nitroreductase family)